MLCFAISMTSVILCYVVFDRRSVFIADDDDERYIMRKLRKLERQKILFTILVLFALIFICCVLRPHAINNRSHLEPIAGEIKDGGSQEKQSSARTMYKMVEYYKQFEELRDVYELPDPGYSKLYLLNKTTSFELGDIIRLRIILHNGWGERIREGGDVLRVWMEESEVDASSAGYVLDNGDGSYDGVVKALWQGQPEIRVSIACTKHQIAITYRRISKYGIFHYLEAAFRNQTSSTEFTRCSVQPKIKGYSDICNLTSQNYGLEWYCGKPVNLPCSSWTHHTKSKSGRFIPNGEIENKVMVDHQYLELKDKITVNVNDEIRYVKPKPVLCNSYSKSSSWDETPPTGYFYQNKWKSLQCIRTFQKSKENYKNCLSGRPLIIYGDSTARQWYMHLYGYLDLQFVEGFELEAGSKHHSAYAVNKDSGLVFVYAPHEIPFYSAEINPKSNYKPLDTYLDQIENGSDVIVVLHWYIHFTRFLPHIYKQHIQHAKMAMKNFLERTNADVYIKSPHAIMDKGEFLPLDYIRLFQIQILKEVFHDIRDRITLLNEWDITVASKNLLIHPSDRTVEEMVYGFMSRACFKTNLMQ